MGRIELSPFAHLLFALFDRLRSLSAASLPPFPPFGRRSLRGVQLFLKQKSLALQMFLLQSKGFSLEMGRVELSPFAHFLFAHCDRLRSLTAASLPPFPPVGRRSLRGVQLFFKTKKPLPYKYFFRKAKTISGDGES